MARAPTKSNDVPIGHHAARYCHPQRGVIRDPKTKQIQGLWPQAFELRPATTKREKETYLSLNHFEHFGTDPEVQFSKVLKVMRTKFMRPPEPVIARLSADIVIACGTNRGRNLRLRQRGTRHDPSYVHLEGLPLDNSDKLLLTDLAKNSCVEIRTAAQIQSTTPHPDDKASSE